MLLTFAKRADCNNNTVATKLELLVQDRATASWFQNIIQIMKIKDKRQEQNNIMAQLNLNQLSKTQFPQCSLTGSLLINIGRKLKREIKSKRKTSAIEIPCANCDKMPPLLRRLVYFQQSICEAEKRFLHYFPSQNQVNSLFCMPSNSSGQNLQLRGLTLSDYLHICAVCGILVNMSNRSFVLAFLL